MINPHDFGNLHLGLVAHKTPSMGLSCLNHLKFLRFWPEIPLTGINKTPFTVCVLKTSSPEPDFPFSWPLPGVLFPVLTLLPEALAAASLQRMSRRWRLVWRKPTPSGTGRRLPSSRWTKGLSPWKEREVWQIGRQSASSRKTQESQATLARHDGRYRLGQR